MITGNQIVNGLIIHMNKFLDSDWLKEMHFSGNTMQKKKVIQCKLQRFPKLVRRNSRKNLSVIFTKHIVKIHWSEIM